MIYTGNKEDWNAFVLEHGAASGAFLQSWQWGEFLESEGKVVERFASGEARCQVVRMPLPRGFFYGYVPRGPLADSSKASDALLQGIVDHLTGAVFVRADLLYSSALASVCRIKDVQPADTLVTSLESSAEELLANMHQKTRYNIRLAERKGVQVIERADTDKYIGDFVRLVNDTAARHGIRAHGAEHYKKILKALDGEGGAPHAYLSVAMYADQIVAANMMIDWAGQRVYLHGASSNVHKSVMAPYVLHWKLMQEAKALGLTRYDWWGIAPEGVESHPLKGVTRFKMGFGGERVSLPGTFDLVARSIWYRLYRLAKRLRK